MFRNAVNHVQIVSGVIMCCDFVRRYVWRIGVAIICGYYVWRFCVAMCLCVCACVVVRVLV